MINWQFLRLWCHFFLIGCTQTFSYFFSASTRTQYVRTYGWWHGFFNSGLVPYYLYRTRINLSAGEQEKINSINHHHQVDSHFLVFFTPAIAAKPVHAGRLVLAPACYSATGLWRVCLFSRRTLIMASGRGALWRRRECSHLATPLVFLLLRCFPTSGL